MAERRLRSGYNRVASQTRYEWGRNLAFVTVGLWMMEGLRYGFWRVFTYLSEVQLIGPLLIWKLTAMVLLGTLSMVVISSLVISLTTLYYASDLRFLMRAPSPLVVVFADKAVETVFFSSWMIVLVVMPIMTALAQVGGHGAPFLAGFAFLLLPSLVLAASVGMIFSLVLMALFPSSRTRDAVWILSSLAAAAV